MKLSDREWTVLDALWTSCGATLGELTQSLQKDTGWNRNTVLTYLTRMENKGLVDIDKEGYPRRYHAALSREKCQAQARDSFLKEQTISAAERDELRRLLDEMEV